VELVIDAAGAGRCMYDEMIDLASLGRIAVERASHVEPDDQGRWMADLGPVGGPVLGPFERRSDALAAEMAWLSRWLTEPASPRRMRRRQTRPGR